MKPSCRRQHGWLDFPVKFIIFQYISWSIRSSTESFSLGSSDQNTNDALSYSSRFRQSQSRTSGMTLEIWKNRQDSAGHFDSWGCDWDGKALSKLGGLFSWAKRCVVHFNSVKSLISDRRSVEKKESLQRSSCNFISFLEQQDGVRSQLFWLKTSCGSSRWSDGGFFGSAMAGAVGCSGNLLKLRSASTSAARTRPRHLPTSLSQAGAAGWTVNPKNWRKSVGFQVLKHWPNWKKGISRYTPQTLIVYHHFPD